MNRSIRSISFQQAPLEDFSQREWIISNGMGGYASSSLCGMNTRRYHGLLVTSQNPPTERRVFLSRLEEEWEVEGNRIPLSTNQYPGAIHPKGYEHLTNFSRFPLPSFEYQLGNQVIRKRIGMVYGSSTTLIEYQNLSSQTYKLRIRPHFVDRGFHELFYASDTYNFYTEERGEYVNIYPRYHGTLICLGFQGGSFQHEGAWYQNNEYFQEQKRGLDFREDTYSPGFIHLELLPGESRYVVCSLDEAMMHQNPAELFSKEIARQNRLGEGYPDNSWEADLARSSESFIAKEMTGQGSSLIAGYPWFEEWGRDSLIALRGILLCRGKNKETRSLIKRFLSHLDKGLIPSCFPENYDFPEYNSADTSLWLFVALYEYVQQSEDWEFIEECLPGMRSILDAYIQGTRHHIHLNKEGFIFAGSPNSQLTWMDSFMWGYSVTPRWGCPVEVNALWYNALKIFQFFSHELGEQHAIYLPFISLIEENFRKYFWHPLGYLYDVVIPGEQADEKIRPNQVYALSLPFKLLAKEDARQVLHTVKLHLCTPKGLRSLSPEDPEFKGTYEGGVWDRNTAYHQGTVWSFLYPEYLEAFLWVHGESEEAKQWVREALLNLRTHFYQESGIGGISEIFDGLNPSHGKGTIHQARSVGNLLHLIHKYNLYAENAGVADENLLVSV